ncbi:hypothetical protein [Thiomicrorhabdus aquaedulcis]|uniref:hypothetical protein n=1 Tax=Thiomicrorhabdus aquaedulcis TaxID=2211106 RepID=UPI000FD9DBED|nr:hypothetical protein [Thiomicrorhabdus aquaedulcis]
MAHILRYPGLVIGSSLTVALLIWGFWPQAQWVEVATVQRAPLTQTLEEDGQTRLMNRYIITAPIDGETCKMHLNVGDSVELGQHLLTITPQHAPALDARHYAQAQAQVAAAQAALESAKTQVNIALANSNMAQVQLTRHHTLLQKGLIAQDTYDQSNTAALTAAAHQRSAQFKVDVAHYELQAARAALKTLTLKITTQAIQPTQPAQPIQLI